VKSIRIVLVVLSSLSFLLALPAKDTAKGKVVDSGTFEIVVDGKRVGTETFNIQDRGATNVTTSQIKVIEGTKAEQASVLEMSSAGDVVHYAWREISPGKAQTSLDVTPTAVVQHITMSEKDKQVDLPYMTAASTMVLDDNFFIHRQLLVWRYLRGNCTAKDGKQACTPVKMGVLVPAQHIMAVISLEPLGMEKMTIKGVERELLHLKLMSDDVEWGIWADPADGFKILRFYLPSSKTEVLRN
jgi:hypothetical protein